jgi:DNA-binding response OmpR family regulator
LDDSALRPLILIVDDELLIRESLANALDLSGYETLTAAGGEEALRLYETHDVAAIVTDIYMGGTDGFTLINALRGRGETLPIIVMSGGTLGMQRLGLAKKIGADATLEKPFKGRDLERLLERLLDREETSALKSPSAKVSAPAR